MICLKEFALTQLQTMNTHNERTSSKIYFIDILLNGVSNDANFEFNIILYHTHTYKKADPEYFSSGCRLLQDSVVSVMLK